MMNGSSLMKAAVGRPQGNIWQLRTALFHSTPVLERRRRNHWEPRFTKPGRTRKPRWKQFVMRDINEFAEELFQSWRSDHEHDESPNKGPSSWSQGRQQNFNNESRNQERGSRRRRNFDFCDDDAEVENIFRSAFGGDRFFFWSFVNEDNPRRGESSSSYSNGRHRSSWHWRYQSEEEDYDSAEDHHSSISTSASDRLALGLKPSGPLKLEDVKSAYRNCALKFHPDRHQGASKSAAEEKFKLCTAAYQSLCDKLSVN